VRKKCGNEIPHFFRTFFLGLKVLLVLPLISKKAYRMKRNLVKYMCVLGALLCISFSALANTVYSITLTKTSPSSSTTPTQPYPEPAPTKGHRSPSMPILCTISDIDGVYISTMDNNEDIYLYEVYDENNTCIGSFSTEVDFLQFFYENIQYIQNVVFYTPDYVLTGYL
jgi:hypothetical protein